MDRLRALSIYAETYMPNAGQFSTYRDAREWMEAGVPAGDAAAWASLGYLPGEAAPLIAQDVTPQMVRAMDEAAVAVDGGREAHLRAEVMRLAEQGLIIDPELADRLGLDED